MAKEELCEKVINVRRVNERMMTVVVVPEEDGLRLICGYPPQCGRSCKKNSLLLMSRKMSWICIVHVI